MCWVRVPRAFFVFPGVIHPHRSIFEQRKFVRTVSQEIALLTAHILLPSIVRTLHDGDETLPRSPLRKGPEKCREQRVKEVWQLF